MIKLITTTLLILASSFSSTPTVAKEKILNFHSDISIKQDSSVNITETIKVQAEGYEIRRGIYRDFPTKYKDKLGNNYQVAFDVKKVTMDGQPVEWFTSQLHNGVRLYLGSKDKQLSPGVYEYKISYKTDRQLGYFEQHDELYWNVTGNDWKFIIEKASITIHFPQSIPQDDISFEGYTGYMGQTGSSYRITNHTNNSISFKVNGSLLPAQGFTIAVGWPKGYIKEPSKLENFLTLLNHNGHLLFFIGGLLLTFGYYFLVWLKYGKDPKPGVIIPLYDPPKTESPAAMRYILRNYYDHKTFTTAVISLATKGYLTIEEHERGQYSLKKTNKEIQFSAGEKVLVDKLFANNALVSTQDADSTHFIEAMAAHRESLKNNYKKSYFNLNLSWLIFGFILSMATIILGIVYRDPFANIAIPALITIGLLLLTNVFFGIVLKAPTAIGRKFMDKAEGLRHYLTIAEGDDLRKRYPLSRTPQNFERYLPYAFALDIEETWANYFSDILRKQFLSKDGPATSTPAWYLSAHQSHFTLNEMTNHLNSSFVTEVMSASMVPGSSSASGFMSSGGGGGFSGGGGGGGGGGW